MATNTQPTVRFSTHVGSGSDPCNGGRDSKPRFNSRSKDRGAITGEGRRGGLDCDTEGLGSLAATCTVLLVLDSTVCGGSLGVVWPVSVPTLLGISVDVARSEEATSRSTASARLATFYRTWSAFG